MFVVEFDCPQGNLGLVSAQPKGIQGTETNCRHKKKKDADTVRVTYVLN
jgi:hypothetical protein